MWGARHGDVQNAVAADPRRRSRLPGQPGAPHRAVNEVNEIAANRYYVPSVAGPLSPVAFVHKIKVPVFLARQWTDEQTGGHCPDLAEHFTGTRSYGSGASARR